MNTNTPEFKSFPRITRFDKAQMVITQKIHGTNAQMCIFEKEDGTLDIIAGCRTRKMSVIFGSTLKA